MSVRKLKQLRELIDAIDHRLVTLGLVPEMERVEQVRQLLWLPPRERAGDPEPPTLREQLLQKGIEPGTYRDVRRVREKRAAGKQGI